jgi:hypothetical protein
MYSSTIFIYIYIAYYDPDQPACGGYPAVFFRWIQMDSSLGGMSNHLSGILNDLYNLYNLFGGSRNLFPQNANRTLRVTFVFDDTQFGAHKGSNHLQC